MTHGDEAPARGRSATGGAPFFRQAWRALVWAFWIVYFGFVVLVLVLRYGILPNIERYRGDFERLTSQALGQAVSIGRIEASWEGINPDLTLLDVRIADVEGRPALAFSRVEAILSWLSVPTGRPQLRLLRIDEPTLHLRRDASGRFHVAGIPLSGAQGDGAASDWVLAQRRIRIRGATLVWEDEQRQAPPLILEDLDFGLDNDGRNHRFGLTAQPPEGMASRIDVRGDFRGADFDQLTRWSGKVFAEIGYADLAVWRQWVDYPIALPHGRGALRTWLDFSDGGLQAVTADVALQDVNLRFADGLPALDLDEVSGRFSARFLAKGVEARGKAIRLVTRAGNETASIRVDPTDFSLDWRPDPASGLVSGSASANRLDVAALSQLAIHLPFDANTRRLLAAYSPRGLVSNLSVKWKGDREQLQNFTVKAGFDAMALRANGYFPGFSGLSGTLEATEAGGSVKLAARKSTLDVPSVFPVPLIELDALNAEAKWAVEKGVLTAELTSADFAGAEAAGTARGTYRNTGEGPGSIDLTAALTRADARAVWRYMPHAVGKGAREWLRDSLLSGHASEAHLTLRGDLRDFPFLDKRKGQFLVTVKAHDVVLDYARGWPRIEGIDGDLRFEGAGMVVDAQKGTMLGARLTRTRAEIPDFDAPVSMLVVKGGAEGPTAEFLRFIDQSPVAERIDRFTEDMRATGAGRLDLGLTIPLDEAKLAQSKINGTYQFINNDVTVDAALPPIRQVTGSVQFTGADLRVPEINGTLFGGPLKIKGGLQKDGRVLITANGSVNIAQLRKQADSPWLAFFSGTTPYRGEVRINKRNADLVIESTLAGVSSSLPAPFAKAAADLLPIRFEKALIAQNGAADSVVRDRISATLGESVSMQLIRRRSAEGFAVERGAVAIGRPLGLPEQGLAVGMSVRQLDLDAWRKVMDAVSGEPAAAGVPASEAPLLRNVSLKADDLRLFGRHLNEVDLQVGVSPTQYRIRVASRQANGDVIWDSVGAGRLTANLRRLVLEPSDEPASTATVDTTEKLPALDVTADEFLIGRRDFGRLELAARNEAGIWRLNRIVAAGPHGTLTGQGQWQTGGARRRTQLEFKIESDDVGKLLERMDYPGTVRAGAATLSGRLGWDGSPVGFDYSTLNGEMTLDATRGQFLKLDPGAAGKLLGLISLQSLPRRITLDFRDVFSEGFAFDAITSKVQVQNGLMRTDRLQIDGPSARVLMRGEVDLENETQRLTVNVQPELGGTAALGVALVNPVAGVATWVAHKILQNPLNQMFGYSYLVSGAWNDPKVEKISGGSTPASPVPRLPNPSALSGGNDESTSK